MSGKDFVSYHLFHSRYKSSKRLLLVLLIWIGLPAHGQSILPGTPDQTFRICKGDTVFITVDTTQNTVPVAYYEWYHNGAPLNTSIQPRLAVKDTGIYTAISYGKAGGCGSPVSNRIVVRWKELIAKDDIFYTDPNTRVALFYQLNDEPACTPLDMGITFVTKNPARGQLLPGTSKGSYIYQPDRGFVGVDTFFYYLKDTTGLRSDTARVLIYVGHVADKGIANSGKDATIIYPNPVSNFLYIKGDMDKIQEILLIDDRGRRLHQSIPKLDITAIDMRRYAAAVYFVQVRYKDGTAKYFKVLKPK